MGVFSGVSGVGFFAVGCVGEGRDPGSRGDRWWLWILTFVRMTGGFGGGCCDDSADRFVFLIRSCSPTHSSRPNPFVSFIRSFPPSVRAERSRSTVSWGMPFDFAQGERGGGTGAVGLDRGQLI